MTMCSKFLFPYKLIIVYKANVEISVSGNLGQGLGISFNGGKGQPWGHYARHSSFPANCERAHVHFAGVYLFYRNYILRANDLVRL